MDPLVKEEMSRIHPIDVYSSFETQVIGEIVEWAMDKHKGREELDHAEMVNEFWKEKLS